MERPTTKICGHCGEVVEQTDDGTPWHVEGLEGYFQCRLYATPVEEYV
jgi:hypothetical protein